MTPVVLFFTVLLSLSSSLFAAGREVAPRTLGPTTYPTHLPVSAFAGERFLTVWYEQRGGVGSVIMGAFNDGEGRRLSGEAFPILAAPINHYLQLLATGDSYTLFWRDRFGVTQMAELDLAGHVTRRATVPLAQHTSARIAWNGTYFLAAIKHPSGMTQSAEAVIFDRAGRIVQRGMPLNELAFSFEIVPTAGGFAVVSPSWEGLSVHQIALDGTASATFIEQAEGTTAPAYRPQRAVAAARPDGGVLVVWSAAAFNETSDLESIVLRPDGTTSDVQVIPGAGITPVHLMPAGDGYTLAVTLDGRSSAGTMQVDADGSFRSSTPAVRVVIGGAAGGAASNGSVILLPHSNASPSGITRVSSVAFAPGPVIGPELLSIADGRQAHPLLGAAGGTFLAAWTEQNGDDRSVRTAMLNALAEPSSARVLQDHAFLAARELPWNGTEYLVTMVSGTTLMARRVSFDGTAVEAPLAVLATDVQASETQPPASVTWAGDRWIVVWRNGPALMFATVSRGGSVSEPVALPHAGPLPEEWSRSVGAPAVGYDAPRVLVVWSETHRPPCFFPSCAEGSSASYAALLDRNGNLLDPRPLRLPFEEQQQTFAVTTSGREFLVLARHTTRALVLQAGGNALRIAATATLDGSAAASDVAWDGTNYVFGLRFIKDFRWYAGVTRLDRNGVETAPLRAVRTLPPEYSGSAAIAADPAGGTVIAVQETDLEGGARIVIYRDDELMVLTDDPPPPRRRAVR